MAQKALDLPIVHNKCVSLARSACSIHPEMSICWQCQAQVQISPGLNGTASIADLTKWLLNLKYGTGFHFVRLGVTSNLTK